MDQIKEKTIEIVSRVIGKPVAPCESLLEAGIDSISMIHILVEIEKEFNANVDGENLIYTRYVSVEDIIKMVSGIVK